MVFVCDSAANMVKAINDMGQFNVVRFMANSIQLSVNTGIITCIIIDDIYKLINKLRKIVSYLYRN